MRRKKIASTKVSNVVSHNMKKIIINLLAGIFGFVIAFTIAISCIHGAEFTKDYFISIWKMLLEIIRF